MSGVYIFYLCELAVAVGFLALGLYLAFVRSRLARRRPISDEVER